MIIIALNDLPPSVNKSLVIRAYGPRMQIGKSAEYTRWIKDAAWIVQSQRKGRCVEGSVCVNIMARKPRANADLDNRLKAIFDALQKGGAIANDSQIDRIEAEWSPDADGLTVTVRPLNVSRDARAA